MVTFGNVELRTLCKAGREALSSTIDCVGNERITLRKIRVTVSLNSDNTDTNIHGALMLEEVEDCFKYGIGR
jgi:hypothetical protein